MQKLDHNIGFWEKRQFFLRKLLKIAENCDHNIDPWFSVTRKSLGNFPNGRKHPEAPNRDPPWKNTHNKLSKNT
jgi:hypothetical protein